MIVKAKSFAKVNLFLYVTARRDDGYHNLYSLMTCIDLFDDITFTYGTADHKADDKTGVAVFCDHPDVPGDSSNLAYKAAKVFFQNLPDSAAARQPLTISIEKRIPPGGGLGGGSSNAAVVLTSLNDIFNQPFTRDRLMEMGLNLGADVPFFIFGKPAIAQGVGEQLTAVEKLKPYHLLLCNPGIHSSTAQVYKNLDFGLTKNQKHSINTRLNVPIRGQEYDVRDKLYNDLETPAFKLNPGIRMIKEEMESLLRRTVRMSGSGSSLFALYSEREKACRDKEMLAGLWAQNSRMLFVSSFR